MKIVGIVLILLQVMAIMGGGIPSMAGGAYALARLLGFFFPGILGVILLCVKPKKK